MSTLAELRTDISARLLDTNNTSVSSANITTAINDSIRYYKKKHFWFNETLTTISLVEGNAQVTNFPTDYLEPLEGFCSIYYSQQYWPVRMVLPSIYDLSNIEGRGMPYIITEKDDVFYVYYIPDQAYTMQLYYLKDYTDLSADSDTNDFTTKAEVLIRNEALARIYSEFKQDEKMETYYTARAKEEYQNLIDQTQGRFRTGYLEIEQI